MPSDATRVPSYDLNAIELASDIRRRRISPVDVVEQALARIAEINPPLNAFIAVFADQARAAAKRAERLVMRRGAKLPALFGVPVSVKDIVFTTEAPTTAGSRIFGDGIVAKEDAPARSSSARPTCTRWR